MCNAMCFHGTMSTFKCKAGISRRARTINRLYAPFSSSLSEIPYRTPRIVTRGPARTMLIWNIEKQL